MEFDYTPSEGEFMTVFLPTLPVILEYKKMRFPVGHALVDTGADMTLLPMDIGKIIGAKLDETRAIKIGSAGGGGFTAIPSKDPIIFSIEQRGFRSLQWKGTPFFAPRQPIVLLGHFECLDQLNLTFEGKKRKLSIEKA